MKIDFARLYIHTTTICVCVCVCVYIYIYIYTHTLLWYVYISKSTSLYRWGFVYTFEFSNKTLGCVWYCVRNFDYHKYRWKYLILLIGVFKLLFVILK
jgi:hypothetical protein